VTGTFSNPSDIRLKNDVATLSDKEGLAFITALRPVSFTWKDERRGKGVQFGFIAQEVEKLKPQIVQTQNVGPDKKEEKSLNYQALFAPLVKAVQELKADNDNLRAELHDTINSQDAEIEELRSEIRALKADNEAMGEGPGDAGRDAAVENLRAFRAANDNDGGLRHEIKALKRVAR
jgi:hypothetical protein